MNRRKTQSTEAGDKSGIHVRRVTLADVAALVRVHSGRDDPWGDPVRCALSVNHRLLRPFHCDVALVDGKVVGHAEWIASNEPAPVGRQLYLGMMDVRPDMQRRGIGSAMIRHGRVRAQRLGCDWMRTSPDTDAMGFYRKCGFAPDFEASGYRIPVVSTELPSRWRMLSHVRIAVVKHLPMRLGWVQGSSAHMWEICNHPLDVAGELPRHPCASRIDRQAYVQLRRLGRSKIPLVVAWASDSVPCLELVEIARVLATGLRAAKLSVWARTRDADVPKKLGDHAGQCSIWSLKITQGTESERLSM